MNGPVNFKKLFVAFDEAGYQCQYLADVGTLIAKQGNNEYYFSENSSGEAIGIIPKFIQESVENITETQAENRFNVLTEVEFSPSKDTPTGIGSVAKELDIKTGDQVEKGTKVDTKEPQAGGLPGEFTGDSDNNEPAEVEQDMSSGAVTSVGAEMNKSGKPGPNNQKPEKRKGMKVGNSLQQQLMKGVSTGDYDGSEVGELSGDASVDMSTTGKGNTSFLPKTQGAQSFADIPAKVGKMTVTSSMIDDILFNLSEEEGMTGANEFSAIATDNPANQEANLYVFRYNPKSGAWTKASQEIESDKVNEAKQIADQQQEGFTGSAVISTNKTPEEVEMLFAQNPSDISSVGSVVYKSGHVGESRYSSSHYIRSLPRNILSGLHEEPIINHNTYKTIDLNEFEQTILPIMVDVILEADEDDLAELDDTGDFDMGDDGSPDMDDGAGIGGEGADDMSSGEMPDMGGDAAPDMGAPDMGAPDMGGAPEEAPTEMPPMEEPVSEPIEPISGGGEKLWNQILQQCPNCDKDTFAQLYQMGLLQKLLNTVSLNIAAQNAATKSAEMGEIAGLDAMGAAEAPVEPTIQGESTNFVSERGTESKRKNVNMYHLDVAWESSPSLYVDALLEVLVIDPDLLKKASSLVLGLDEGDYINKDIQEAYNVLQGLEEQVREVRNQVIDIRNQSIGKIQSLVGNKFAKGVFIIEANSMSDRLNSIVQNLNSFLEGLGRSVADFQSRYNVSDASEIVPEPSPDNSNAGEFPAANTGDEAILQEPEQFGGDLDTLNKGM